MSVEEQIEKYGELNVYSFDIPSKFKNDLWVIDGHPTQHNCVFGHRMNCSHTCYNVRPHKRWITHPKKAGKSGPHFDLVFVALRDIPPDTELLWDYGDKKNLQYQCPCAKCDPKGQPRLLSATPKTPVFSNGDAGVSVQRGRRDGAQSLRELLSGSSN